MIDEFSILQQDGLSIDLLESLSYRSNLNYSLKRTLRHFDKNELISEIENVINWYGANDNKYGVLIREKYECVFIRNEASFKEVLEDVLSSSKEF